MHIYSFVLLLVFTIFFGEIATDLNLISQRYYIRKCSFSFPIFLTNNFFYFQAIPGPGKLRSGRDGPLQGVNSASAMPQATREDLNILYKWYFLKTIF